MNLNSPPLRRQMRLRGRNTPWRLISLIFIGLGVAPLCFAHGVAEGDALFIEQAVGMQLSSFSIA